MGAGLAWLDYDGDGWTDLYAVQSGRFPPAAGDAAATDRLFRNHGDGSFQEMAVPATGEGYGQGATAADVDGDGAIDLYLCAFGGDTLLHNLGDGSFAPLPSSGIPRDGWSSSGAFADADGDGDLDLYVARYLDYDPAHDLFCGDFESGRRDYCDPSLFAGVRDLFLRNAGDGTFVEVGREVGLGEATGKGLGVVFSDLDGDGLPDLYVANDLTPNFLFRNRGGRFEDLSLVSGAAVNRDGKPEAGMGIAVGDVDRDGDPELAVTNFDVESNTLYENLGGLQFADVSAASGFGLPSFNLLGFGIVFADLDLDGDLDAYIANGHIFEEPRRANVTYAQPDLMLAGDGAGGFRDAACPWLAREPRVGRGLAAADYDNDGDPDLAELNNDGPLSLWRNGQRGGRWLGVILAGRRPNTQGVGARLTLARAGASPPSRDIRWLLAGDSYQSASDKRILFGLGEGGAGELEVHWPSRRRQRFLEPPPGRYLTVYEPGEPAG